MTMESGSAQETTILLTAQEAADYLRIPLGSLYVRISKKKLPCTRLGRLLRFKKSELDRMLEINATSVAAEETASSGRAS